MESFFYAVVTVVPMLGVLILVHEFGHFAAAKLFGVRVEVFSIGFGKRLCGFRVGETDYRISALPFGGYVKMTGENPSDEHTGGTEEFVSHPRWQRLIIALAGPFMNAVLAIALLTGVFMVHYEHDLYLDQPAVIGWVMPNSAAAKAGIEPGDRIVEINHIQNPDWDDVRNKVLINANQTIHLVIDRNGERLTKTITPELVGQEGVGDAGLVPQQPLTVTILEDNMPGHKVLQLGDEIVGVDGMTVRSTAALRDHLQQTKDKTVTLAVVRHGQQLSIPVKPAFDSERNEYRIGFGSNPQHVDKLPFAEAFQRSMDQNKKNSLLIVEIMKKLVERKVSIKQMSGPIGIARVSGEIVRQDGFTSLLAFMSLISINLAIFNLLPIPILDGGLVLLLLIEALMRRDINEAIKLRIYQAAAVCLMIFASLVIFNDVMKLLPGLARHLQ